MHSEVSYTGGAPPNPHELLGFAINEQNVENAAEEVSGSLERHWHFIPSSTFGRLSPGCHGFRK